MRALAMACSCALRFALSSARASAAISSARWRSISSGRSIVSTSTSASPCSILSTPSDTAAICSTPSASRSASLPGTMASTMSSCCAIRPYMPSMLGTVSDVHAPSKNVRSGARTRRGKVFITLPRFPSSSPWRARRQACRRCRTPSRDSHPSRRREWLQSRGVSPRAAHRRPEGP